MKAESKQRTIAFAVLLIITAAWPLLVEFRVISLPLLPLWVCLYLARGWHKRDWLVIAALTAFFVSSLSPVDLYVPGLLGSHYGEKKSGTRLVRQLRGKVGIEACEQRYGEFIYGGGVVGRFDAKWLLVLDWAAEDGAANGSQPIRSETNGTSSAAGSRR